jgi:hypothetical protein
MGVQEIRSQLYGDIDYVCGGHGARRPSHGRFQVPAGITIKFYVHDKKSLPNSVGQQVDRVLAGERPPLAARTVRAGEIIHDYHLYSARAGGYLNLGMSSKANARYISTSDKDTGLALSEIVRRVRAQSPNAVIHWSACRSVEGDGDSFGWSKPKYEGKLGALATRKG